MTTLEAFEDRLHGVLSEIDGALEERWGARWPLHPARPPRGAAANPQYDGLFRVTAAFSAGFGSKLGPGYLFRVEMSTLADVPAVEREAIEAEAAFLLREGLARAFPGRQDPRRPLAGLARFQEGVYFFCCVGPKLEAVTEVTSEGFGR